jgi:hypothetical protein
VQGHSDGDLGFKCREIEHLLLPLRTRKTPFIYSGKFQKKRLKENSIVVHAAGELHPLAASIPYLTCMKLARKSQ